VAAFQAAERRAANKIGDRFFGSTHYTVDDGSSKRGAYGYRAGDLDKAKDLPWGTPEKETHRFWELDHWGASAAKGFGIDGFGGDVDGLATLVGWHGGDKASEAWGALGDTFSGLGQYTTWPYDWAMSKTIGGGNGDNEQKKAFREALKGFVAWDEWDKDPVRAGGQVLYNVTPFGVASKLGKMAKGTHLAEVTKVTKVVDSVTAGTRAARAALPKASDVLQAVKRLPHWGDAHHMDRTVDAADDLAHPRDAGVRLPDQDGESPTVLDNVGNIRHANGEIIHRIEDARKEGDHPQQSLPEDHPAHERAPEREKATVGGGADHQPPRAHAHTGDGPSAHHNPSAGRHGGGPGAGEHNGPSTGGHGDGSSGGHGDGHSTGGHHGPSSGGHGDGASGGHGDGHSADGHHGPSTDNPGSGPDAPEHDGASGGGHSAEAHHHGRSDGEPDFTRGELPPGTAERTLHEMRAMRHGRARYKGAEDYLREMAGGSPERHYPVPTHDHPYYPVEAPRGRHVDVPVDLPDGRTLAMEVKHYLEWRTVHLKDGGTRAVRGEVPLNDGIVKQINKDLTLRRLDPKFDPRWVFLHAPPSQELRNYLTQARIIFIEYGPAPK
ncbi:hypothetical protein ACH4SI_33210, partial [Streptomyces sp. NPDC021212]